MRNVVRKLAGLPLVALVLAPGAAALAQTPAGTPAATSLGGAGGAVRSDVTFSLTTRYDSNVPRLNDGVVSTRGLEREDIRVSPAVLLDVSRNLGRNQIGLRSYLGYDFYVRNTPLNRERLSVEPFAYLNLPVCDLSVSALASRRLSDLGELVYVGIDPTIGSDNTEIRKRINGKLVCGDAYGLRPTFEIERASGDNSNPRRQIADFRLTRVQSGIGYSSPALGEIVLYAYKQDIELPNQRLPNGGVSGYTMRAVGVQYGRNIGTRLNFNGSVSQVEVTPNGGNLGSRSGLNGSVTLTMLASDRLQFIAFANRNFTSTLTGTSTYQLVQGYGLTANYAANDRLRLHLGGQVLPRRFFYSVTPTGPFISEFTRQDIFGGVNYNLNRRMRLNLDGGYSRREADLAAFNYHSFYATLGVSVSL